VQVPEISALHFWRKAILLRALFSASPEDHRLKLRDCVRLRKLSDRDAWVRVAVGGPTHRVAVVRKPGRRVYLVLMPGVDVNDLSDCSVLECGHGTQVGEEVVKQVQYMQA
jgi:hypothetical protein